MTLLCGHLLQEASSSWCSSPSLIITRSLCSVPSSELSSWHYALKLFILIDSVWLPVNFLGQEIHLLPLYFLSLAQHAHTEVTDCLLKGQITDILLGGKWMIVNSGERRILMLQRRDGSVVHVIERSWAKVREWECEWVWKTAMLWRKVQSGRWGPDFEGCARSASAASFHWMLNSCHPVMLYCCLMNLFTKFQLCARY